MFPHKLTDSRAFDVAQAMLDGFNRHYRLFREVSAAARRRFEQAHNACATTVVLDAWDRGQAVIVHGWIYGLHNGLLEDLRISAGCAAEVAPAYGMALGALKTRYDAIRKKGQP